MSRRNRSHGRIASVETMVRGGTVDVDAAAGATSVTMSDAGDFDEDGGTLAIGMVLSGGEWDYSSAQLVEYVADDETGILTLSTPLAAAAEAGDPVHLWDPLYEEAVEFQEALVVLDGDRDNPEEIDAEVAEGVGELPEGDRGRAGESCTLKRVSDDEWEVVAVGGRSARSKGPRWEQDDYYALTAADITAGAATMPLSHRPANEALTCYLAGVPQRPINWTIDYNAQTLTIQLSGWEEAGNVLWVHYAYLKDIATRVLLPDPTTYLGADAHRGSTEAALTLGPLQVGDLVVMAGGSVRGGVPVPRGSGWVSLDTRSPGSTLNVGLWYRLVTADDPIGTVYVDSSNVVMGSAVAVRGAGLGAWACSAGTAGPDADFSYSEADVATTGAVLATLAVCGTNDAFVTNPAIRLPIDVEVDHYVQGYGSAAVGREVNVVAGTADSRTGSIVGGPGSYAVYAIALEPGGSS